MRTNRRKMMKLISCSYERIEYIESNGSSYIDTGIYGSDSLDIEISLSSIGNIGFFLISRESNLKRTYGVVFEQATSLRFDYYNNLNFLDYSVNQIVTIRKSGLDIYVNNVLSKRLSGNKFTTPSTLLMFGILQNGEVNSSPAGSKIYFLKMKENGMLVRDFIPVKRKSDGVIGMYDLVGRKFYTSPNGVAFTG